MPRLLCIAPLLLLLAAPAHSAATYDIVDLGTLGAGGQQPLASSQVAGNQMLDYALNPLGHVVGDSHTGSGLRAFLRQGRRVTDLGTLGGGSSCARGINARDQVVGFSYVPGGEFHAFLWNDGTISDLGTLGGDYSTAFAINDAGQIVGQASGPGNVIMHAAMWSEGALHDLGDLGSRVSIAYAIDPAGKGIVGAAVVQGVTGLAAYHAVLWSDGAIQDLNELIPDGTNWVLEEANGIDESGQITGWGERDGVVHAFLLVPGGDSPITAPEVDAVREMNLWRTGSNPTRSRIELGFALPHAGPVTLQVIDVAGRIVRSLVGGETEAGTHAVAWNLDDDAGHRVSSGAYFVRLVAGGEQRSMRMSIVR